MATPKRKSGFVEWLPEDQVVEDVFVSAIRRTYELHGFAHLFLRSVEPVDVLLRKDGDTNKEIYGVQRLQAERDETVSMGLHFDLTVPFARYVKDNAGHLSFPFKRYQIQRSWRGERPQKGRYREFIQADADVVSRGPLPLAFDIELPALLIETMAALPVPPVTLRLNNVKILEGFCQGLGIEDPSGTLRIVDKLDKIGADGVRKILTESLQADQIDKLLALADIETSDASFAEQVRALGVTHDRLEQGLDELTEVMRGIGTPSRGQIVACLRIARGLDYYTGTVFEGVMEGHEGIGSVCSGGRYDRLAGDELPGIGISIGVTRLLGILVDEGKLTGSRQTPTAVLVALNNDDHRPAARELARSLRDRGVATEVFPQPLPYGKQIKYALNKGIPYVWFAEVDEAGVHKVKDLAAKQERPVDPATWTPPAEALEPHVVKN
ncbi:MAG: histidine--tRNA ligase [Myxococcota bacterium]